MITVYTKPRCQQCTATKKYLSDKGVKFQSINVLVNEPALQEMKDHGYQSLPVVRVGTWDNSWSGFRPDRLAELAKENK